MDIFYPIQYFSEKIVFSFLKLEKGSMAGEALNFFFYDTIKILILLCFIIFTVSIIRSFLPPEKIRKILSSKGKYTSNVLAALFGIVTPFCSCSAIALFLGFIEAGVPLGATFSFLVSSPMINEVALVMLFGMFGIKVALLYVISGLLIAIFAGIFISKLNPEHLLEKISIDNKAWFGENKMSFKERIVYAKDYTKDIIKKVWVYIIIGIGVGAWIHGYIPSELLIKYVGVDKWYAVPLATLIGIPLYSNAAGIIPLVSVLTEKGLAIGTTLAFMMAVTALSLPEFIILRRIMKPKLIVIFATVVGIGIIFTGYLFNFLLVN